MVDVEFEPRNNKDEFKHLLSKCIVCILISLVAVYLFTSKFNRSGIGESTEISMRQIFYIVIFFVLVLYAGYLSIRNMFLSIREYIISDKYNLNLISISISAINFIAIIFLLISKAIYVAGL